MKTKSTRFVFSKSNLPAFLTFCIIFLNQWCGQNVSAQGAIALTFKNFIAPAKADYFYQGANASGVAIPSQGVTQVWDYSQLTKNNANNSAIFYVPANNPAYPAALRQFDNHFSLAGIPIAQTNMEGNDKESYHGLGTHFERQAFPLQALTGNTNDSLIIDEQDVQELNQIFEKYTVTYLTSFNSHSISKTNFHLSIAAFGLDHVPGQFVQHTYDSRKVVGFGKVRVPADNGPSDFINALLQKLSVLKIDSVYLAGHPAPPALLAAFGVTQGETTRSFYQYRFYHKGTDAYVINFSMDPTFSTITGLNYDTKHLDTDADNIIASSTNDNLRSNNFSVKVYPNPSPDEFTINLTSKLAGQTIVTVFDLSGRQIQRFENVSSTFKFGRDLKPGTYLVQVTLNNEKQAFKLVKSK